MYTRACEAYLERLVTGIDGVYDGAASYTAETVRVSYDPDQTDRETIEDGLSQWGYRASEPSPEETPADRSAFDFDHIRMIFAVVVIAPVYIIYAAFFYPVYLGLFPISFLDNHAVVAGLYGPIALFTTIIVFGVGFPVFRSAYIGLRERRLTVNVLVALSAFVAYSYSMVSLVFLSRQFLFFDVATTVIVVATIGNHVRAKYKRRAVKGLTGHLGDSEATAHRLTNDGETETISPTDCTAGDHLLVKPGEHIPLDGTIIDGQGAVNEALITGEARPQRKASGDEVVGGSVAVDGAFEMRVGEHATSTLDQLRDLVWRLQTDQTNAERLTNRVTAVYTPLVCGLAVVTFVAWLVGGATVDTAFLTALTVLVVACPVSLGLVTPLALGRGLSAAADRGIPVLDQTVLERVTDADVIAFDKTGTLTTGEMRVTDVDAAGETDDELLQRAAAVESRSSHPIAAAIQARAPTQIDDVTDFERYHYGVVATIEGTQTAVGNLSLFDELDWEYPESVRTAITRIRERGELPTVVGWDGKAIGVIALADTPREQWTDVVETFAAEDRQVVVITGDDPQVTEQFEAHPGVETVFADVSPETKEEIIRQLREDGSVTMVGDGTNDAPALASADLGVAMVSGTDFTVTVADALVTGGDLTPLTDLFDIARGTRRRLIENLGLALIVPLIGLPLAVAGYVTPVVAAGLMGVAALLVLGNNYRSLTHLSAQDA
jgi:Cu2+-exporting ATPase